MRKWTVSISAALLAVAANLLVCQVPAVHAGLDKPYDWTVEAQTQKLARQFDYPGSTLQPIVKADIKYYPTTAEDNKTAYEYIWFSNGKALGLERLNNFGIAQGDGISIRMLPKSGTFSPEERKMAPSLILRLILDAYLNRNPVVTVRLPNDSFDQIMSELRNHPHIFDAPDSGDVPAEAALSIFLQSESSGLRAQLLFI